LPDAKLDKKHSAPIVEHAATVQVKVRKIALVVAAVDVNVIDCCFTKCLLPFHKAYGYWQLLFCAKFGKCFFCKLLIECTHLLSH